MWKLGLCLGLAGVCGLWAPGAQAQDKGIDTLTRSSQWLVNFDDNSCQVMAEFGPPEDRMVLRLTRYSEGDITDLTVIGNRVETHQNWPSASFDFGLGGKPVQREVAGVKLAKLPAIMATGERFDGWNGPGQPPRITPAQEAAVTGLNVKVSGKKSFRLQFGPLDRPMKVMRQCLRDLVQSWGYDPAVIDGISRPVRPDGSPAKWVTDDDYPVKAVSAGHIGLLRFRLDVDDQGKVSACHILDRTDPDDFAALTCKILTNRARFKPALDAKGTPVRAYYMGSFTWKM